MTEKSPEVVPERSPVRNVTIKKLVRGFGDNAFGYTITDMQTVTVAEGIEFQTEMSDGVVFRIMLHPEK